MISRENPRNPSTEGDINEGKEEEERNKMAQSLQLILLKIQTNYYRRIIYTTIE